MQLYNNNFIQKDITRLKFLSRKKITHANKIPGLFSSFSVFQDIFSSVFNSKTFQDQWSPGSICAKVL